VQLTSIISFIHYAATMSGYYAFLLLFLLLVISLKIVPLNLCCKLCFFLVNNQNLHYKCVCFSDVLFSPCCQPKSCTVNVCFFLVISPEICTYKCVLFHAFLSSYQPKSCTINVCFFWCVFSCYWPRNCTYKCVSFFFLQICGFFLVISA